jgi:DNA-binding NtrC family response regulator
MHLKDIRNLTWNMSAMYIEDDQILLTSIQEILEQFFYDIRVFSSAKDALDSYYRYGADIVIADTNIQDINGFEIYKLMKQENQKQLFIATSVYKQEDIYHKIDDVNIEYFITKPLSTTKLLHSIQNITTNYLKTHS